MSIVYLLLCVSVDHQLNAKIADLELGSKSMHIDFNASRGKGYNQVQHSARTQQKINNQISRESLMSITNVVINDDENALTTRESEYDKDYVIVEDLLANWIAPEVISL
jgi:hypothetical protein